MNYMSTFIGAQKTVQYNTIQYNTILYKTILSAQERYAHMGKAYGSLPWKRQGQVYIVKGDNKRG